MDKIYSCNLDFIPTIISKSSLLIIIGSEKTTIKGNNISYNKLTGVLVGDGNLNTTIMDNNITYNKATGINMSSGDYVYVLSNMIAFNQNPSTSSGSGVYVNSNITKIEIKGNYIRQNGQYGVLNDYRARNMDASKGAEKLETIENNRRTITYNFVLLY